MKSKHGKIKNKNRISSKSTLNSLLLKEKDDFVTFSDSDNLYDLKQLQYLNLKNINDDVEYKNIEEDNNMLEYNKYINILDEKKNVIMVDENNPNFNISDNSNVNILKNGNNINISDEINFNILDYNNITDSNDLRKNIFINSPLLLNSKSNIYCKFLDYRKNIKNICFCFKSCFEIDFKTTEMSLSKDKKPDCEKSYLKSDYESVSFVSESIKSRLNLNNNLTDRSNSIKIRSNNIFTNQEIRSILNLKTIKFVDMPKFPIKVGEASFSDVFMINGHIYKIIPFDQWYGMDSFCKEAFILQTLSNEEGVCKLIDRFIVNGKYSLEYLKAWDDYKSNDNTRPSKFAENQLYGVLVMEDCGCDLEKYKFTCFDQILSFIDQILTILINLEQKYKFEHRDMHWGNVMIKNNKAYIIDLNFSRLELNNKILYTDLNTEEWLFEGDSSIDLQFEIYKKMRKSCKSNWKIFNRKSNMLWMKYLIKKLELKSKEIDFDKKQMEKIVLKSNEFECCKSFKEWFSKNS